MIWIIFRLVLLVIQPRWAIQSINRNQARDKASVTNIARILFCSMGQIFLQNYQGHSGQVFMPADFPTRLYMVTLLNGSPKIPS